MPKTITITEPDIKEGEKLSLLNNECVIIKCYKKHHGIYKRYPEKDKQIRLTETSDEKSYNIEFYENMISIRYLNTTKIIIVNKHKQQHYTLNETLHFTKIRKDGIIQGYVIDIIPGSKKYYYTYDPITQHHWYGTIIDFKNNKYEITAIPGKDNTTLIFYDLNTGDIVNVRCVNGSYTIKNLKAVELNDKIAIVYENKYIYTIAIENDAHNDICSICEDSENNIHLIPCGHMMCYGCLVSLVHDNKLNCPYCNQRIKGRIPTSETVLLTADQTKVSVIVELKEKHRPNLFSWEIIQRGEKLKEWRKHKHSQTDSNGNKLRSKSTCYKLGCEKKT